MAVEYQPSDLLPLDLFRYSWRITDDRWSSLPEPVLHRIKPLSPEKSKGVFEKTRLLDPGCYRATRHVSLEGETESVKLWFRKLPIASNDEIYLCWERDVAAVTDWSTFVNVWDDFWYPFDRLYVFVDSLQWAVVLGPEEEADFVERVAVHA